MSYNLISYLHNLHNLRKNQWLNPFQLEQLQLNKLKALFHHAYHKVDYYRRLFDQVGIRPEDIRSVYDIVKIPITTRGQIQSLYNEEIIAKDINPAHCLNLRTSGSTGMPLDIFISGREIASRWLSYRRMYFNNGGRVQDRTLIITSPQNFRNHVQWFNKLGILKERYISVFDDTESQLEAILEFRPQIMRGYASALKNLASETQDRGIKGINPRIIFSTAELLSGQDKEFISSVFRSRIFDYYACLEAGIIAWECKEHSGYHINSDNVIVEFIKQDGTHAKAGEEGEIVITSLNSYTMPFIRYRLGDIAIPSDEKCCCGRTFPLMKVVAGRTNDCIILPDGRRISPYIMMIAMDKILAIKRYQIIQEKENKVNINIFQIEGISREVINDIGRRYKEILGDGIDVETKVVAEQTGEKIGKSKVIISIV